MTKRTTYTKEFKLEAIRLLEAGDKPGTQIARELGLRRNMLYKRQDQLSTKGEDAFKGAGRKLELDYELKKLQYENEKLKDTLYNYGSPRMHVELLNSGHQTSSEYS
jgi:transposase